MSRSGYSEDYDEDYPNALDLYRNAVACAFKGKRGQAFLHELLGVLDAMPDKKLAANVWVESSGAACALGTVAQARGLEQQFSAFDPDDSSAAENAAHLLNIAPAMARELVWINDDSWVQNETDEDRWVHVRAAIKGLIRP
jgi:hypothetical protein